MTNRRIVGVAVLAMLAAGAGFAAAQTRGGLTPPTDRESFDYLVAASLGASELCDRIDRRALGEDAPWNDKGFQVRTLRAKCFHDAAMQARQPAACARVEPVSLPERDGSRFTPAFCREKVAAGEFVHEPRPDDMVAVIKFMRAIGYGDREIVEFVYQAAPHNSPTLSLYPELRRDDVFLSRVRAARGYDEPPAAARLRTAHPVEVLFQMVAIDLPDASLCGKISPNASFVDQYDGKKALLRVRCYESIAFNTGDLPLCERLPRVGAFPHAIPEHDSRENCLKTVGFYRSSPHWRGGGYGWQPFAHAPDFTAALVAIGYTDDGVIGTAVPTDEEYWQFLMHLRERETPEAERAAFVRRVLALPPEPRR